MRLFYVLGGLVVGIVVAVAVPAIFAYLGLGVAFFLALIRPDIRDLAIGIFAGIGIAILGVLAL